MVKKRGEYKVSLASADVADGVSVVIPSYNAADWLPSTTGKIQEALLNAGLNKKNAEIVIVDDGSSDQTSKVVTDLSNKSQIPIIYVHQKNGGRYVARKNGVSSARFANVWFIDSRVYVAANSLKFAYAEMQKSSDNAVWNAHVNVQKKGNIIARFMDAITFIGWRKYFKKPRRVAYGLKEFDHYPKGTTSFLAPKRAIESAMEEFEREDRDIKYSSDDTHLIRIIARDYLINLSPRFSCVYHARTTLKGFVLQAFYRGRTFVDGFFRPGTRFYVPLIAFLVLSALGLLAIVLHPALAGCLFLLLAGLWVGELLIALLLGLNHLDALSLFALSPVFFVTYGMGIWVAIIKRWWRKMATGENRRNAISLVVATLFFVLCTSFYYLGNKTIGSCTDTLASGAGDQTGLIWLNSTVNAPLWGSTNVTNAPYGESLQSPTHITGALEYGLYWLVAQFSGSVCGYNLFTALGFIFSAMIVFLFTRSITKRNDVALFAGFAASFTPYLQIKTGVHPSYAFFGIFVIAIWLALSIWRAPTAKKAIMLGLVSTSFFFFDPYFILLGGLVVGVVFATMLTRLAYLTYRARGGNEERIIKERLRRFLKCALLAAGVTAACGVLPLLIVNLQHGAQINQEVSNVRSDIKVEAFTYSARPSEYLLPAIQNPYLGNLAAQLSLPDVLTRKAHGSNPAEDSLSLSILVMVLSVATCVVVFLSQFNRYRHTFKSLKRMYLLPIVVLVAVGFVALVTSFPPKALGISWPSDIITNYLVVWRVFARLAVIVAFAAAIIAAIGLAMVTDRFKAKGRRAIVILAVIIVAFEYLTFIPFNDNRSWSYSQVNSFYKWLRVQPDIDTIAEYPLNEPGRTSVSVDYFRDQYVHKKRLINTFRAASAQAPIRNGLRNLRDPQTPGVLAALGVDMVVVHAEDKNPIPSINGLELIDWNNSPVDPDSIYVGGEMWVYRVTAAKDEDGLFLVPGEGFSPQVRINSTYTEAGYVFNDKASLSIFDLKTGAKVLPSGDYLVTLTIFSADNSPQLIISQAGRVVWQGNVMAHDKQIQFTVNASKLIELKRLGGKGEDGVIITNMDMRKL